MFVPELAADRAAVAIDLTVVTVAVRFDAVEYPIVADGLQDLRRAHDAAALFADLHLGAVAGTGGGDRLVLGPIALVIAFGREQAQSDGAVRHREGDAAVGVQLRIFDLFILEVVGFAVDCCRIVIGNLLQRPRADALPALVGKDIAVKGRCLDRHLISRIRSRRSADAGRTAVEPSLFIIPDLRQNGPFPFAVLLVLVTAGDAGTA